MHTRPNWTEYYLGIAGAVAARGECRRRQVGAVIVTGDMQRIFSTGYNGAPPGQASCLSGACPRAFMEGVQHGAGYAQTGCNVIHAEANAIIRAGREACNGCHIFITCAPCELCRPLIAAAGIRVVVYKDGEDSFLAEYI